ncbi:CaiB/BaiF CoA transferase family protein [Pacificimonas flava]|uniref:L-carnitine dehydratase/bile acid-inducible protein F n=1 Tax=Pacificimonas flava TaxID=1234595 RepID=M2SCF0_9SPHN|nr:CoA transferase [Pacificimonas flava]EMD83055.1 L-carnitine dehydratase/bile acid-inducible protein F [Pacificimonas flava]MBB5280211.1 crotonobetainyl-CoA:carnitine CoA-transferase CaiB-like acyl-CoA transferase [Pacificimonas flava]
MSQGPLAGVKIVDFGQIVSAPMAAMWLAEQGAEVVKVEPPSGDPLHLSGPSVEGYSAFYASVNRAKRLETLDLADETNRPRLMELIGWADILLQNFRPGVADRLGLGWKQASAHNPRLIYCSISGFGPDGPYAGQRVYDMAVQAVSGMADAQSIASGGRPTLMADIVVDKVTALTAAQAVTAALYERERSGRGQHIELAMLDAALAFHWPDGLWHETFPGVGADYPPYARLNRPVPAKDGAVILGAMQYKEAQALARAVGMPQLMEEERFSTLEKWRANGGDFWRALKAKVAETPVADLREGFIREEAIGAVINPAAAVPNDPQVRHRELVQTIDQPGCGPMRAPRHPARFGRTPVAGPKPAPCRHE